MNVSTLTKVYQWLFWAFCFIVPVSSYLSVRVLAVLFVFSFFIDRSFSRFKRVWTRSWDILLYLGVLFVGLIYTSDHAMGWRSLETSFALLAFPFVITVTSDFEKENLSRIFPMFMSGLVFSSLICIGYATFQFTVDGSRDHFFFYNLTDVIGFQPTYMAYYIILCITFGLFLLYYDNRQSYHPAIIPAILVLFCMLILTSGQTAFVGLLLSFSFFLLKYLIDDGVSKRRHTVLALTIIMLAGMFVYFNYAGSSFSDTDYWERSVLWEAAVDANVNPLIGVGTGDYKSVLNDYFMSHNMIDFAKESFNAHNQWIQMYFSNGLFGILSMIFLFARPLYLATRDQNALGILVFFPLLIYSVTEVILGRYQGIIFFIILHQSITSFHFSNARP